MKQAKIAHGQRGMAATAFPAASEAACEVLRAGGNAIDAAVAAAWALSVCEPSASGLGGQTTMLIRLGTGRSLVIDGHSYAPVSVSRKRVSRSQQKYGHRACVIPSTPATLAYAQRRYGRLSHGRVLEPAILLAEEGYAITSLQRRQLRWCWDSLSASTHAKRLFLCDGRPFQVGQIFRQPSLAATLRRLAEFGAEDFYQGGIARAIVEDMRANEGLMSAQDLEQFELPVERAPLAVNYCGYEVLSVPPPGGGLQVLLALKLLERLALQRALDDANEWYFALAVVIYTVFCERELQPIHPADWSETVTRGLLGASRIELLTSMIQGPADAAIEEFESEEAGETTHLCTADDEGNVVSLTQSIQSLFGAKVANAQAGFLYNNYLTTCPRRPHPYRLGPRCLARSNAAPTLVLKPASAAEAPFDNGEHQAHRPLLAVGAAGSRRILTSIVQVINGVIDRKLPLGDAVAMPRIHAKLSRKIWIERSAASAPLCHKLAAAFREVSLRAAPSYSMGAVQAIQVHQDGTFTGAADPRRDGTAVGVQG